MRKLVLFIIVMFSCLFSKGQINLVHNPSFESHWRCPQEIDMIRYSNFWTAINDTVVSSADTLTLNCFAQYCHICSDHYKVKIPESWFYTHYPRSGDGMIHMLLYFNEMVPEYQCKRDYIQGRLKNALLSGNDYCVTFYVSLTGGSAYANNKIGAYLDDATIDTTTHGGWPQYMHTPQIIENTIITDTVNWTKIQGMFTATGVEKFITIGNFSLADDIDTIATHFPHASNIGNIAGGYYIIDDVSVIKVGTVVFAGNDTTINEGDTIWVGEHVNYVGDSVWHNDFDDYAPVKWYTATGALIDSNHSGLQVHPAATTKYVMELDVCGTLSYDTVTVTVIPVGIDGVRTLGAVKVWPNPATNVVHVSGFTAICSYRLVNAVGVCMMQGVVDGPIDIGRLSKGVYVLELLSGEGDRRCVRVLKL